MKTVRTDFCEIYYMQHDDKKREKYMEIKKGLLYEMADGYRIDLTEEEYNKSTDEINLIAQRLGVNMEVLDILEKSYKTKLLILSMVSYFGYKKISGAELLKAACLKSQGEPGDIKYFFIKAGWMPYYLEYEFTDEIDTSFSDLFDYFFDDIELYMDMSEHLASVRVPNALRLG